ncbi:winged helix-turn-helix transcriptional regulator [Candidatus Woesearchaeota archaeon]|nr:winged helix-turn-helix transcriptional regulator [Candidatus Woesearchaeota archaeon]
MKRGKLEIIKDILAIIQNSRSIKLTPLLRKSNLSSKSFYEYFNELKEKELIKEIKDRKNKKIIITEKGLDYLNKYKNIIGFIEEFDL